MSSSDSYAKPRAREWYKTEEDFLQVCKDAVSQARSERDQEFANDMMKRAKEYKLDTYLSLPQLANLCRIADHVQPPRRF